MLTVSEVAVTAAIWGLTAAGGFFGTRAALRKRKLKRAAGTAEHYPDEYKQDVHGLTSPRVH